MIIIISEKNDITTNKVIEWLLSYDSSYQRVNMSEFTKFSLDISNNKFNLKTNNNVSKKIWIRRGKLNLIPEELNGISIISLLRREERPLFEFYEKKAFGDNIIIGSYEEGNQVIYPFTIDIK